MATAKVDQAVRFLRGQSVGTARFGVVLGSGLGGFAELVQPGCAVPYASIPHFVQSTVPGHRGVLHFGRLSGEACLVMAGRFHLYEGYTYEEVTFPVQVMRRLGVETLVVTNSAGGIRRDLRVGSLMLVRDHIAILVDLLAPSARRQAGSGRRHSFYSPALLDRARGVGAKHGIPLQEGTLALMKGPCYETPAELEMLRRMGADAVTMSTIPEVVEAARAGVSVLGISVIANLAFGLPRQKVDHRAVIAGARKAHKDYACLLKHLRASDGLREQRAG